MTVWEKNLEALSAIDPQLRESIAAVEPAGEVEPLKTASGHTTFAYRGRTVHSRYNPFKEAEKFVLSETAEGKPDSFILYGFGLGYAAEICADLFPDTPAFIIIPDLTLFAALLRLRDVSNIIRRKEFTFLLEVEPEKVPALLSGFRTKTYKTVRLRGITDAYPEYFRNMDRVLGKMKSRAEINRNTLLRFGKGWVKNFGESIPSRLTVGEEPHHKHTPGRILGKR